MAQGCKGMHNPLFLKYVTQMNYAHRSECKLVWELVWDTSLSTVSYEKVIDAKNMFPWGMT